MFLEWIELGEINNVLWWFWSRIFHIVSRVFSCLWNRLLNLLKWISQCLSWLLWISEMSYDVLSWALCSVTHTCMSIVCDITMYHSLLSHYLMNDWQLIRTTGRLLYNQRCAWLWYTDVATCDVPRTRTSLGTRSLTAASLHLWNNLQSVRHLFI